MMVMSAYEMLLLLLHVDTMHVLMYICTNTTNTSEIQLESNTHDKSISNLANLIFMLHLSFQPHTFAFFKARSYICIITPNHDIKA